MPINKAQQIMLIIVSKSLGVSSIQRNLKRPNLYVDSKYFFPNGKEIASAKSKGALLVSATEPIKNITNTGNKGTINHIAL